MIRIQYVGGLCNRAIQYSFGRILADRLKLRLICERPHQEWINAIPVPGKEVGGDYKVYNDDNALESLTETTQRQILVYGFFQNIRFYENHRDEMRKWFWQPDASADIHPDDILVHIRRGDFFIGNNAIKLTYYRELLQTLPYRNLVVIGSGIDAKARELLKEFNPHYTDGNAMGDFKLFKAFRRVIASNSTFSWLGTWLSDCEVWYPVPGSGYFSASARQNLRYDEQRTHWIEGVEIEE